MRIPCAIAFRFSKRPSWSRILAPVGAIPITPPRGAARLRCFSRIVYEIPAAVRQCAKVRPVIEPPMIRTWKGLEDVVEVGWEEDEEGEGVGRRMGGVVIS
jgi:hypothetical protein